MRDHLPRVLLITPWAPYPFDGGSKRVYTLCRLLRDRFRFHLLTFAPRDEPGDVRAVAKELQQEAMFLRPVFDRIRRVRRPEEGAPGPAALPEDVRRFRSEAMFAAAGEERRDADIIHVEYDLMAPYAQELGGLPKVFTQHDVGTISFTQSYFREMAGWRKFLQIGPWLRRVRFERDAGGWFDRVVVTTAPDKRRLSRIVAAEKIRVVQTGVDLEHFAFRAEEPEGAEDTLAYVGHYPHFPNEDAVVNFCRRVLPLIRRRRPKTRLLVVGSSPTPAVLSLARDMPGIVVTGTVDDVKPHLDRAGVFVAPIRLGQGIKGKLLEAFASGVPVVASTTASAGLDASAGRHLLVADRTAAFAEATLSLMESSSRRARLAREARAFVEERYDWNRLADGLGAAYQELLGARAEAEVAA
ncbi:MAG: glycosyltransferase [Elusimicrobia bacterium]|nr:glycosyltransferase [Elusimicrobiota bacterium]